MVAPRRVPPDTRRFVTGLARAFGGAIIFGLPMLMTAEMWALGTGMRRLRLALLLVGAIPLLVGLSAVSGFERTRRTIHDVVDAFVALTVGAIASAVVLGVFGVIRPPQPLHEIVGLVALQAVPASIGALLAASQFGPDSQSGAPGDESPEEHRGYRWEMFLMAAGALFLAFNIAPTEEVMLLGMHMSPWHTVAAMALSVALMHAFVYASEFSGQATVRPGTPFASVFVRYTVAGYALVLLMTTYILWTFGRLDGMHLSEGIAIVVTLGVPSAVGAAAARLLL